jgi:E3 ubiquitin-protein ligase UBR4
MFCISGTLFPEATATTSEPNQPSLQVRKLITYLTKDNAEATRQLNGLICAKIAMAIRGRTAYPDLVESVRHEIMLLAYTVQKEDACWEDRLRCVLTIFVLSTHTPPAPIVLECVTLPCLRILQSLITPAVRLRRGKEAAARAEAAGTAAASESRLELGRAVGISAQKWIENDPKHTFQSWEASGRRLR